MAALTWSALGKRSVVGVGATSATDAPTGSAGMSLDGVGAYSVWAEADVGQTITTAISLIADAQDPYSARWGRAPELDLPNPSGVTGVRTQLLGGFAVPGPVGRVSYRLSAGAVSSGNINIRIVACAPVDGFRRGELL